MIKIKNIKKMNWNLIYQLSPGRESRSTDTESDQPDENVVVNSDNGSNNEREESYQKKLFENDLYVWSLLLLIPDKKRK